MAPMGLGYRGTGVPGHRGNAKASTVRSRSPRRFITGDTPPRAGSLARREIFHPWRSVRQLKMDFPRRYVVLVLVLAVGMFSVALAASKLPSNIKRCARTDPNVNACLVDAVQDALPKLKGGLPKLGVHPLDPLIITEMRLAQGSQGPINMELTFTNMTSTKVLDDVTVLKVRYDFDANLIEATTVTPHVHVASSYTVKGRVLLLPITGSGPNTVDLYDITCNLRISGKKITKDGKLFFDVTDVDATLTPKKMKLKMENLFNGDKQLGEAMNRVLNDNWEQVYQEIGPSLNGAYSELFKRPARALFLHVPIDEIFPLTL